MKTNVGKRDRAFRLSAAGLIALLYVVGVLEPPAAIPALIVAAVLLATGLTSTCPVYHLFGIGTCPAESEET